MNAGDTTASRTQNEASAQLSGIFSGGLEAYQSVSDDDYHSVLTSGLVVLDANTLLDLYRYHATTRDELIEIFTRLKGRLWVPHHALFEFFENRLNVISEHLKEANETIDNLRKSSLQLELIVRTWANRIGLSPERIAELSSITSSALGALTDQVNEYSKDDTRRTLSLQP